MSIINEKITFRRLSSRMNADDTPDERYEEEPKTDTENDVQTSERSSYPRLFGHGLSDDLPELTGENDEQEIDNVASEVTTDPDRQGLIRSVEGAQLVYKRKSFDGTYEEMWLYKSEDLRLGTTRRRAILAGTDIPINKRTSEDGAQSYTTWAVGNVEMLKITGLQQ